MVRLTDIMVNGGFESGLSPWVGSIWAGTPSVTFTTMADPAPSGGSMCGVIRFASGPTGSQEVALVQQWTSASQLNKLVPGATITLSAAYKAPTSMPYGNLTLQFFNGATQVGELQIPFSANNGAWQAGSASGVIPAGPFTLVQIFFYQFWDPILGAPSDAEIDNVVVDVVSASGSYVLTIATNAGGTTNPVPSTTSVIGGTQVTISAQPNNGYKFDHWVDVANTTTTPTANPYIFTMNSNHSVTAVFVSTSSVAGPLPTVAGQKIILGGVQKIGLEYSNNPTLPEINPSVYDAHAQVIDNYPPNSANRLRANYARVGFNTWHYLNDSAYKTLLNQWVAALNKYGVAVVMDAHSYGQNWTFQHDIHSLTRAQGWALYQTEFLPCLMQVCRDMSNNPLFIGVEINEFWVVGPDDGGDGANWTLDLQIAQDLAVNVHTINPALLVFTDQYPQYVSDATIRADATIVTEPNVIICGHFYAQGDLGSSGKYGANDGHDFYSAYNGTPSNPILGKTRLYNWLDLYWQWIQPLYNMPFVFDEIGFDGYTGTLEALSDFLDYLVAHNWGWCYFSFYGADGIGYTVLIRSDWSTLTTQGVVFASKMASINPPPVIPPKLTLNSLPQGVSITVDGTAYTTNTVISLPAGSHALNAPASFMTPTNQLYVFSQWDNGSNNPSRTISLTADTAVTATYVIGTWNLAVSSTPTGIPITVDGVGYTTNTPQIPLPQGQHTVVVPATYPVGGLTYAFQRWEDSSTNTTRMVTLNSNLSIVATYAIVDHNLTVNSVPSGVAVSVDGVTYVTNTSPIPLTQGAHTIVAPARVTSTSGVYAFQKWEDNSTNTTHTIQLNADMTVTATYVLVTHNLTISSTPTGVAVTVDAQNYTTNTTVTLPEGPHVLSVPPSFVSGPTTYTFQRWEDGTTASTRTVQLLANAAVSATYVAVHPTLTLLSSPAGAGTLTAVPTPPYEVGQTVVINAAAVNPVDYTFKNWLNEDSTVLSPNAQTSVQLNSNRTLTAEFTSVTHPTLTLLKNPADIGGTISASPSPPYSVNQNVTVSASPPSGYFIGSWQVDGVQVNGTTSPITVRMDTSHVVVVNFARVTHNLIVASDPITGVPVSVDGSSYSTPTGAITLTEGSHVVVIPAVVGEYAFQKWEDNSKNTTRTISLTADRTITCFFAVNTHTLTINTVPAGVGGITVDGAGYTAPVKLLDGILHTIVAPSTAVVGGSNYAFLRWEDGSTSPTRVMMLTADTTIAATYQIVIPTHHLVIISEPSGVPMTVDGISYITNTSPIALQEGSHTVITPPTVISGASTFAFKNWEDGTTGTTRVVPLTADKTITATYIRVIAILTLAANLPNAGSVSATPAPPYDLNQVVVIEATIANAVDFRFLKWVENGVDYSVEPRTSVTMSGNRSLIAVFEEIGHPSLTLVVNPAESATLTPDKQPPYLVGDKVNVTVDVATGNVLSGWLLDGVPYNGRDVTTQVTMDKSHVLTVTTLAVQQAGFPLWALAVAAPLAGAAYYVTKPPKKGGKRRRTPARAARRTRRAPRYRVVRRAPRRRRRR